MRRSLVSVRGLAWTGSAVLHLAAGAILAFGMPVRAPEPLPVMLLEMPAPEEPPAAPAEEEPPPEVMAAAAPEPPAPVEPPPEPPRMAEAPPEPPPPEPLPPEPEPPPVAEAPPPPEPPLEPPPPEPPVPEPVAELPPPPPTPPPPTPRPPAPQRRPAPPRPAVAQAQPAAPSDVPAAAPSAPVAAPAAPVGPPPDYRAKVSRWLERHKRYPQEARFRRIQGVATLRFRMRRDGTVTGFRLERSTGDPSLDEEVLAMIQRASPLPAAPDDMPGDPIEWVVPVSFTLR